MINITIGQTSSSWEVWETDAPIEYDGFGTFQIASYLKERTVLIRSEHKDWQTNRYGSGFHKHGPSSQAENDVCMFLWNRLLGREAK
jgi:hypothetical protein